MKNKLKTLKDLRQFFEDDKGIMFLKEELKAEAVKWIKDFRKGECWTDFAADKNKGQENVCEWIKYFFNLTEEDLKDENLEM